MNLKMKKVGLALATAGALSSVAFAAAAQDDVQKGGTAVIQMISEQRILNPGLRASTGVYNITGKIMEPLIDKSYDGFEPVLATEWSGSEDGKTITLKLREGVNWHDGEPFTCDDVAFSAMELWKEFLNYSSALQANLESVDCPDPHTAVFNYSKPMPIELFVAAMPDLGHPVPKHLFEGTDILKNEYNPAPVGTGPFKFVEYERGQYVLAEKNEDYWREGYPYLDRIVWRFIKDKSAAAAALEAGEVHESGFIGVSMADVDRFSKDDRFDVGTDGYENNVAHCARPSITVSISTMRSRPSCMVSPSLAVARSPARVVSTTPMTCRPTTMIPSWPSRCSTRRVIRFRTTVSGSTCATVRHPGANIPNFGPSISHRR